MKRVYEKTPVQTLLYAYSPIARLVILDRSRVWDSSPNIVFDGQARELMTGSSVVNAYKLLHSAVREISVNDGALVLTIQTSADEY